MSPVTPTPGLESIAAATLKGAAGLSAGGVSLDAGVHAATANPTVTTDATTDATATGVPNLNPGKLIPGRDEWRALERRASSFRV
ncbi:MAG: hypothetical protein NTU45_09445 [Planctomycetota bacterium]|nr:hypothetical protein [Planctomycetota bacterium]